MGRPAAIHSLAIAAGEFDEHRLARLTLEQLSAVVFLDRVRLHYDTRSGQITSQFQDRCSETGGYRHVLRLEQNHPLLEGLPGAIPIYGECPVVTPLAIQTGATVLVSLDRVPIIAVHGNLLLVGADPWQFGNPSVPVLYKVLSNWLRQRVGHEHAILQPLAVIRFDDMPTTAEELALGVSIRKLDRKRSRTIRRLVKFARRTGTKFTVMYSSHFRTENGSLQTIRSAMPRSLRLMRSAVKHGAFEMGSHGMVHLREGARASASALDPKEFFDLDELETAAHLQKAEQEIIEAFETRPQSFVAPAWGYRPDVTKRIAGGHYSVIVDSSQHVENGDCDVLFSTRTPPANYLHIVETFRSGSRMLTYSNPAFWKCYSSCGIPIHYMQHTDTNWQVLKNFLIGRGGHELQGSKGRLANLINVINDPRRGASLRAVCTIIVTARRCLLEPGSWEFVWKALTISSIYSFMRAMKSAGYVPVTLTELRDVSRRYVQGEDSNAAPGGVPSCAT